MSRNPTILLRQLPCKVCSRLFPLAVILSIIAGLFSFQPASAMDEITVSGAGTVEVNSNYHNYGTLMNGKPYYGNQTNWDYVLYWVGGIGWVIDRTSPSVSRMYYNPADTPFPPQTGWLVQNGVSPAPTLSGPETHESPELDSFALHDPATSPTNASVLIFRATFNRNVQNVSTGDFSVNSSSTTSVTDVVSVSGSVYGVTVSGGNLSTFTGTVGLDLSGSQDIIDGDGLALLDVEPGTDETYQVDHKLLSFERFNPAIEYTNVDQLIFRVSFAEDVQYVDASDFEVHGSCTATVVSAIAASGVVYDVTISGGDLAAFDGQVGLDLSGSQNIADMGSNPLLTAEPAIDETYQVDNTSPSADSFTRQTPATSKTNADTLVFRASFSEDVINVDSSDFAVNGGTTATVTSVVSINPETYDVTVSGGDLAGYDDVVGLDLDGTQDITDVVGNSLPTTEPAPETVISSIAEAG